MTDKRRMGVSERLSMAITGHKTCSMLLRHDTVADEDLREAARN
jgi:hypothetical protein